jgi:hypothetical protein
MDNFDLKKYLAENRLPAQSPQISESIMDKIKSLFQRTPAEVKLLNSLDLFDDGLLYFGDEKFNNVIEKAKKFGMNLSDKEASNIIQKKLAMEIEKLQK